MENVKRYRDRLKRIISNLPPNAANAPFFLERMDELYTKMLEEELARKQTPIIKRKRKQPE